MMGSRTRTSWRQYVVSWTYALATVQFVWFYFRSAFPFMDTLAYERGLERMPFQGRLLMMPLLRAAHGSAVLQGISQFAARFPYWFPGGVLPETQVCAVVDVFAIAIAGWFTLRLYRSCGGRLLAPAIYPIFLVVCAVTYLLHTVQNFRFVYDFPTLAFFAIALDLLYERRSWIVFALVFAVATINRETSVMLLVLDLIDATVPRDGKSVSERIKSSVLRTAPLFVLWAAWQVAVRHWFAANPTIFYPRLALNFKSLVLPQAWPQLLTACGFLLPLVLCFRSEIPDRRLRMWLLMIPLWVGVQFVYGVLLETRVFAELIPIVVCSAALIFEQRIKTAVARVHSEGMSA